MSDNAPDPNKVTWDPPPDSSKVDWDEDKGKIGGLPGEAIRVGVQGVTAVPQLVGDITYGAAKLLGGGEKPRLFGHELESPSTYVEEKLDKYTKAPKTKLGNAGEFIASAVATPETFGLKLLRKGAEKAAAKIAENLAPRLNKITSQAARDAITHDYRLAPKYIGGGASRTAQTVSGGPKLDNAFAVHNQAVTDRLAKADMGWHPDSEFTDENFDTALEDTYQPYEQIRGIGTVPHQESFYQAVRDAGGERVSGTTSYGKTANELVDAEKARFLNAKTTTGPDLLQAVKELRFNASRNLRAYEPKQNALGAVQKDIAKALEDEMDRVALSHQGTPGFKESLQAARAKIAKIETYREARGPGGHIDARDLERVDQKKPGYLTGNAKVIAQTAHHFKDVMHNPAVKGQTGEFSAVDFLLGGTGLALHHPEVLAVTGARLGLRSALKSKALQKRMLDRGSTAKSLARAATSPLAVQGFDQAVGSQSDLGDNGP